MKRGIFFFLEKLQITPYERRTMLILVGALVVIGVLHQVEYGENFDKEFYQPYEEKFEKLSYQAAKRDSLFVLQHYPASDDRGGTIATEEALTEKAAGGEDISSSSDTSDVSIDSINVNTADQEQLEKLPGVGPAIAQRIIEYREEHGPYERKSELTNVRGIGEARLDNIRPYIKLE